MNKKATYNARYIDGYRDTLNGYEVARWSALHHLANKVLKINNVAKVLDYGCGNGLHVPLWQELFPHAELYFADISDVAISQLSEKYPEYKSHCSIIENDKTVYNDNTFNLIVSIEVMEHVEDVNAYLAEIYRILKPGGLFIWTTPCGNALSFEHVYSKITKQITPTKEGYRRWNWEDKEHLRRLKTTEASQLLRSVGFSKPRYKFRAHLFSFICTRLLKGKYEKFGERLMLLDYKLFRNIPNGASMIGVTRK